MRKRIGGPAFMGGHLGTKATSLADIDEFLDWKINQEIGAASSQDLYAAVAWTFWAVNLRADSIAQVPYALFPIDLPEDEEDTENEVAWDIDLAPVLWTVEAWRCLLGAAYLLKRRNQVQLRDLQVLNANSMKVLEWNADGPTTFRQTVGAQHRDYPADEIVYFRSFNPRNDIREGIAPGRVAQTEGNLIKSANEWAAAFFAQGAIPAVILWSEGNVPDTELDRIRTTFEKMTQGLKNAWRTIVLRHGLKPQVIGMPIKDLAMPELENRKKEQILAAHLIPPGLGDSRTNRATQEYLELQFWTKTIIPELRVHLKPVLDKQLFKEQGLRIRFKTSEIEAIQQSEIAKAESASFIVNGVMLPMYEANVASLQEVRSVASAVLAMADLPRLDQQFEPEERTPPQLQIAQRQTGAQQSEEGRPEPRGNQPPKALAPEWGRRRVSLPS